MLWTPRSRADRGGGYKSAAKAGLRALEQAAFPTAVEWDIWWREHNRRLEEGTADGWEKALAHAVGRLFDNQLTLARMIRLEGDAKVMIRYDSNGHVDGEETRLPDDITRDAFLWWLNVARPVLLQDGKTDPLPGVPTWADTLARGIEGCYIQQCRLGIELTGMKRKGYLVVNASATKALPTEKALRDKGMAALSSFKDSDREDQ